MKRKILFRLLFFVYLAAVLFLCFGRFDSTPSVPKSLLGIPTDKIVHFGMFLPFPVLAYLAFDKYTENVCSTLLFTGITFLTGVLLAMGTEWGQARLTSYRSGDPKDFMADLIALAVSSLLVVFLDIRHQKK